MMRRWRLNAPPNWPHVAGAELEPGWQPDPSWGPPPVGWLLWQRERAAVSVGQVRSVVALGALVMLLLLSNGVGVP